MQKTMLFQGGPPDEWFIGVNNEQVGPLTLERVAQLAREGVINRETPVWRAGMAKWEAARQIPEFAAFWSSADIPPPLPPSYRPAPPAETPFVQAPPAAVAMPAHQAVFHPAVAPSMPRALRVGPFLLALLCFMLPFMQVSCRNNRSEHIQITAIQTVFGGRVDAPREMSKVDPDIRMIAAFICAVAGAISAGFGRNRREMLIATIAGVAGVIAIFMFSSAITEHLTAETHGALIFEKRFGFYAICACLLTGSAISTLARPEAQAPVAAWRPPGAP